MPLAPCQPAGGGLILARNSQDFSKITHQQAAQPGIPGGIQCKIPTLAAEMRNQPSELFTARM